jgi:hypothetical protein
MDTYTIYRIRDNETHETYIGSTRRTLEQRINQHIKDEGGCKSRLIIDRGNYTVSALLLLKCNKTTALWLERFAMGNHYNLINYQRSIVSREEQLREKREYNEKNKEKRREYNEKNREKRLNQMKINSKRYYEKNRDKIREYRKKQKAKEQVVMYQCECGSKVKIINNRKSSLTKHLKSNKHINYFNLKKSL